MADAEDSLDAESQTLRWAWWLGIGLLLACLANGSVSYLKRVGVIDPAVHTNYLAAHCELPRGSPDSLDNRCACMSKADPVQFAALGSPRPGYVYQSVGSEAWIKLAKDALFALVVLLSIQRLRRGASRPPSLREGWPIVLLLSVVGLAFAFSALAWSGKIALLGLRPFEFLAIALLGGWLAGGLGLIARGLGWLLILQLGLVAIELAIGVPLTSCPHTFRVAGTLVLPNTLGMACVVAFAFHTAFAPPSRIRFAILLLVVALLVFASGSGTGMVALLVLVGVIVLRRLGGSRRRLAGVLLVPLMGALLIFMPVLTKRPDIYDSLFAQGGRVDTFGKLWNVTDREQVFLGRGLGIGTNTVTNAAGVADLPMPDVLKRAAPFYADSTITSIFAQMGLAGLAAFYLMLLWACIRDPVARPTYLMIFLASLTFNITEVFPINFLLGLLLTHSVRRGLPADPRHQAS